MVKTTTNLNLETDLAKLRTHILKEKYSTLLLKLESVGDLKFQIVKDQQDDGLTRFKRANGKNKQKKATVELKESVVQSEHVCWRLGILLHELAHVLHFLTTTKPIYAEETHGEDWVNQVKQTMIRGGLKQCAMALVSPTPKCIYKKRCVHCPPPTKCEKMTQKDYILPKRLEKSPFGGNCYFCETNVNTIYHLRQSNTCREGYANRYGPQYKSIIQTLSYKENRMNRRVEKYDGPSTCDICQASGDQSLVVHLRNSEECRKASKYETEEDMRKAIQKDNANVRKRKQRATQRKSVN